VSKRLVICCDGTWNTPDKSEGGRPVLTNVAKVALSVSPSSEANVEQRVYYQHGVGVSRWEHIRGGAFGFGLSRNVREAYRFIVENYEPGDELFFFGFSRGAFTARSTVGLIRNAGILRRENTARIDEAYTLYRDRAVHPNDLESQLFRRTYSFETRIRFIGVWDTVGALGIPLSGVRGLKAITSRWEFHDTALSSATRASCSYVRMRAPSLTPPIRRSQSMSGGGCSSPRFGNLKPVQKIKSSNRCGSAACTATSAAATQIPACLTLRSRGWLTAPPAAASNSTRAPSLQLPGRSFSHQAVMPASILNQGEISTTPAQSSTGCCDLSSAASARRTEPMNTRGPRPSNDATPRNAATHQSVSRII
jgi:type VI secretion system (T6SS) phospholipase Tle1-like effector